MMALKSSRHLIFAGRKMDGQPVIVELTMESNQPLTITNIIHLDTDVNALFYNRILNRLCICQEGAVSLFDRNYQFLQLISRDPELPTWNPLQLTLLDQNILIVRAENGDNQSEDQGAFLHAFTYKNNHYEQSSSLKCSVRDILQGSPINPSSPFNLDKGILCKCSRNSEPKSKNTIGFQLVTQNDKHLQFSLFELLTS